MVGKAIYSRLTSDAPTAAIVGTRVFPDEAPQKNRTFPLIVYELTDQQNVRSYSGSSGLASRIVRIECAARTKEAAQALAEAVDDALDNQSGTWGGIVVQGVFQQSRDDAIYTTMQGEDFKIWVCESEYLVWFNN